MFLILEMAENQYGLAPILQKHSKMKLFRQVGRGTIRKSVRVVDEKKDISLLWPYSILLLY